LLVAWGVAGAIAVAGHPRARPRRRGSRIVLRLDRLNAQLQLKVDNYPLAVESQALLALMALEQGCSPDRDLQSRALKYFANDALIRKYPSVRLTFKATQLASLAEFVAAEPLSFVLQVFLGALAPLFGLAGRQPRGPSAKAAAIHSILHFLACLADELLSRAPETFRKVQLMADAEPQHGMSAEAVGNKLDAIYFLVDRTVRSRFGYTVELDVRDFVRRYLYARSKRYREIARQTLDVPGYSKSVFGL